MPIPEREPHVGAAEVLAGGKDVEHGELADARGMIEGEAVRDAPAAIVPGEVEPREPETVHDGQAIAPHRALGVRFVVFGGRWLRAFPVSAQVHRHDREFARKPRGDQVPHHVRLGMPVQEQERRAAAAVPDADGRLARVDPLEGESFEHRLRQTSRAAIQASIEVAGAPPLEQPPARGMPSISPKNTP